MPVHQPPTLTPKDFSVCLQPRAQDAHKGTFGSAGLVGGADGMTGAVLLSARAALLIGTGRVFVAPLSACPPSYDPLFPELMFRSPGDLPACPLTALAIGPGLGNERIAVEWLARALASELPLVLDADALNILSEHPALQRRLCKRCAPAVLTPHPGEAARLLGVSVNEVQSNRLAACEQLTSRYQTIVVLKGAGTLVGNAGTSSTIYLNPTGNSGMAAAGMGDVLTGLICGLLAQGHPALEAARCAVYVHGLAADQCVALGRGPHGLLASDVSLQARTTFNQLVSESIR